MMKWTIEFRVDRPFLCLPSEFLCCILWEDIEVEGLGIWKDVSFRIWSLGLPFYLAFHDPYSGSGV